MFFNDNTAEMNKKLFKKFVVAWNEKKLPSHLYQGVHNSGQDTNSMGRTKHVT